MKKINIKIISVLIISLISLQLSISILTNKYVNDSSPFVDFNTTPQGDINIQASAPSDNSIIFSSSPFVHFSIKYPSVSVEMDIFIKNDLSESISLLNLWIQVNKSNILEQIELSETKILETQSKLSLSTFDSAESMIFHIKLYEGETITPNEEYNIILKWYDPDEIFRAQYDPSLLHNGKNDDIQVKFEYSTRVEEYQLFPIIERHYYQDANSFNIDFKVTNLMETKLDTLDFTYIKIKNSLLEQFEYFDIISSDLTTAEISDITFTHQETSQKIEYSLSFGVNAELESDESLIIKTQWSGIPGESSIEKDVVIWNYGNGDMFNVDNPFYLIGEPFYSLLTPAEPIVSRDYDFDGLSNIRELDIGYDPFIQDSWLVWESLRSDYYLDENYFSYIGTVGAHPYEIRGKVTVIVPNSFSGTSLVMDVESFGFYDEIIDITVNNEVNENLQTITTIGQYLIANPANEGLYEIEFTLSHYNPGSHSYFIISFLLDNVEVADLSSQFALDSDGDGLIDDFESEEYIHIPDADLDGAFDGADFLPLNSYSFSSGSIFNLNIPIKNAHGNSEITVGIEICPTSNDYTKIEDYRGNQLMIFPGMRIYGNVDGGDYLPDNIISADNDKTGLLCLNPTKHSYNDQTYSWAGTLNYKSNNAAKNNRQIKLKYSLVWLLYENNPVSGNTELIHIYPNTDPFVVQGVSVTESEPTSIILGIVDDGSDYRKTIKNAELAADLSDFEEINSKRVYPEIGLEISSSINYDLETLNDTRDSLRTSFLQEKNLDYETTNFIYITYGYSLTYNLEALYDAFPNKDFSSSYSSQEIDDFYLIKENSFHLSWSDRSLRHSRS